MSENNFDNINDPNELNLKHQDLMDELDLLEKEFKILKESLFIEKFQMLNAKIAELKNETAPELIELAKKLDAIKHNKITSQKFRRRFRINSVWNEYLSEIYSFERTARFEKNRYREKLRDDIKRSIDKIDKQLIKLRNRNLASTSTSSEDVKPVSKRLTLIDKLNQRKIVPISPSSPYIVYNLDEDKIEEDLSMIRSIDEHLMMHEEVVTQ